MDGKTLVMAFNRFTPPTSKDRKFRNQRSADAVSTATGKTNAERDEEERLRREHHKEALRKREAIREHAASFVTPNEIIGIKAHSQLGRFVSADTKKGTVTFTFGRGEITVSADRVYHLKKKKMEGE